MITFTVNVIMNGLRALVTGRHSSEGKPLIVCAALTGGLPPHAAGPGHPLDQAAIVEDALACHAAGAAVIHIHARLATGETTMEPAAYAAIAGAIRGRGCDAVLDFSAGDDGGRASHAQRLAVVGAGAEIVSFAGGSFNLAGRLYDNRPSFQVALAAAIAQAGLRPEIEIFDSAHLQCVPRLAAVGVDQPLFFQFVMGLPGTLKPDPVLLEWLLRQLPDGSEWSVSAQTGPDIAAHAGLLEQAVARGGHVRTGLEDTRLMNDGSPAPGNAALVGQWVEYAARRGRPVATPAMVRLLLGIAPRGASFAKDQEYGRTGHDETDTANIR